MTSAAATQRSQLESVLQLVDQTRTQLPTLLRTFAIPSTSSELASIWTERSNAAAESLRRLKTGLESIDGIVVQARESERRDGTGIIVTPRERQDNVLGGLNAVLGDRKQAKTHELNQVEVRTRAELEETLQKWNLTHARVTCTLIREEEVAFELKGIMKCTLMLNRGNDELRSIQVERVACFGLKEQRSNYMQSEFILFQDITNGAMALITRSRNRRNKAGNDYSNIEEILNYLSNPPLPF